jgi:hypothetical protein
MLSRVGRKADSVEDGSASREGSWVLMLVSRTKGTGESVVSKVRILEFSGTEVEG